MASNRGFPVSQLAIKLRAATLAIVMAGAATLASAAPPAVSGHSSSLALGDSVVFGYIAADGYAYVNPSAQIQSDGSAYPREDRPESGIEPIGGEPSG